ncbi:MAG TPA: hypothetical protein VKU36_00605 [Candidatus Babeliales bacterium]|nr:hypothetical protein [Candidatus Babeliales bacterium]
MKLIPYNCVNIVIMLTIIFSADTFGMRMTQAGKEKAKKYLQKISAPSSIPLIFYDSYNKQIELKIMKDKILTNTSISPTHISSYNLSPKKKYLVYDTHLEATTVKTQTNFWGKFSEKIKNQLLEKMLGHKIGAKIKNPISTKIIDIDSQTEIISFDCDLITYTFSPDEKTFFIARKYIEKNPHASKGSLAYGTRTVQDFTRYELIDIDSKSVIKTFENVQTIDYLAEDSLIVQYDDNTTEQITLQRNTPSSLFSTFQPLKIIESPADQENITTKITYYGDAKNLYVTPQQNPNKVQFTHVTSFAVSPNKKYVLIMRQPSPGITSMRYGNPIELSLINTLTGQTFTLKPGNSLMYTFSSGESYLLILGGPLTKPVYTLFKTSNGEAVSIWENNYSFYFDGSNSLIMVDKKGNSTSYNPHTDISHQALTQQKTENQLQELQKQLEKENQKEEELIQQQQEYQKYYEESPSAKPEKSFFEQAKEYLQSFWSTKPELPPVGEKKEIVLPLLDEKKETEEEFFEPEEEIEELMNYFNDNKEQNNVTKIVTKLSEDNDQDDRNELLKQYNNSYNDATKKQFASVFFAAPYGALETSHADGISFDAHVVNDLLYIRKKSSQEIIFSTKEPFADDIRTMTFSAQDDYLILSFKTLKGLEIFAKEKNSDSFGLSQSLELTNFAPIIGIKCITTSNNKTYFFFIDANYKMGMYNPEAEVFSLKSTSKKKI